MGNSVFSRLFGKTDEYRTIIMGLDAAGKTSILYKLKLGEVVTTIPTIGFNVETVKHKEVEFTVWDVGGRCSMRPLFRHYYPNTQALVFVVDSNDTDRFEEAMEELCQRIVDGADELDGVPVLVLANKQDLPGAMTPRDVGAHIVEKGYLRKHPWCVFGTSIYSSDGQSELYEGLEWLRSQVTRRRKQQWFDEHVTKDNKPTKAEVKTVDKTDSNNNNTNKGTDAPNAVKDTKGAPKVSYLADVALTLKSWLKT